MIDQKRFADKRMLSFLDPIGLFLADGFHLLGLFAIGGATVWAAGTAFYAMIQKGRPSIEDLLLLFIYLEIGSMVAIYFRTNHMPVRFLLYVGITALTRHMIGFVREQPNPDIGVLSLAGATLILAFAVLIIRFASNRFPSPVYGESGRTGVHDD
jgi:protein PsiE